MAWWVLVLAVVVGALMGMLGGGGAILTVPILTSLVGQSPHDATAGSLVIVGVSSLVGMLPYLRQARVRVGDAVAFGLLGTVGSVAGAWAAHGIPGPLLMTLFAGLLLVVAGAMAQRVRSGRGEGGQQRGWPVRILAATGVGLLTGFFGVGGGFVIVPALTLLFGLAMTDAVGTSLLVIAINCAISLAARAVGGVHLDWRVVAPFTALMVVGALVGARLARRVAQRHLQIGFIALLLGIAAVELAQNVPQLLR